MSTGSVWLSSAMLAQMIPFSGKQRRFQILVLIGLIMSQCLLSNNRPLFPGGSGDTLGAFQEADLLHQREKKPVTVACRCRCGCDAKPAALYAAHSTTVCGCESLGGGQSVDQLAKEMPLRESRSRAHSVHPSVFFQRFSWAAISERRRGAPQANRFYAFYNRSDYRDTSCLNVGE